MLKSWVRIFDFSCFGNPIFALWYTDCWSVVRYKHENHAWIHTLQQCKVSLNVHASRVCFYCTHSDAERSIICWILMREYVGSLPAVVFILLVTLSFIRARKLSAANCDVLHARILAAALISTPLLQILNSPTIKTRRCSAFYRLIFRMWMWAGGVQSCSHIRATVGYHTVHIYTIGYVDDGAGSVAERQHHDGWEEGVLSVQRVCHGAVGRTGPARVFRRPIRWRCTRS